MKPEPGSVPPRVWIMRIRSGPMAGTATSWDGAPSSAYIPYVPESLLQKANAEVKELRSRISQLSSFDVGYQEGFAASLSQQRERVARLEEVAKEAILLCESGCVEGEMRENSLGDLARAALGEKP